MKALPVLALLALAACNQAAPLAPDVSVETLRQVADRFDAAQIAQDGGALELLADDKLVFVGSGGVREGKKEFIAGFVDPTLKFNPVDINDRTFVPLGPDAGVVGGDVVLSGTAGGEPFASRIRFADTFRRVGGEWKAVHIQVTRVPEPAAAAQ